MRMESMELQHAVFETEEKGRVDAMWSDVRLHAGDIPDGWHCYAVRGGDGGWPPCSIEKTVWVNHAGDGPAIFSRGLLVSLLQVSKPIAVSTTDDWRKTPAVPSRPWAKGARSERDHPSRHCAIMPCEITPNQ